MQNAAGYISFGNDLKSLPLRLFTAFLSSVAPYLRTSFIGRLVVNSLNGNPRLIIWTSALQRYDQRPARFIFSSFS